MTISPKNTPRRSIPFLLGMCSLMLGANLVWVSYNSVLLPTLVEKVLTQGKGLAVGVIGFVGTMLAILVSILAGILSDHAASRWGRRTPFILFGSLLALPLIGLPSILLVPAWHDRLLPVAVPIIFLSFCGMQFATNVGNGAWWPLLVDLVSENQRGTASGIEGLYTMLGAAIGVVGITLLNGSNQTGAALWLVGAIFALSGILNVLVIRGQDKPADSSEHISLRQAVRDMFRVRTRVMVFFWVVFSIFLAYIGINSLQFFARYFFQVYFPNIPPDSAFRILGGISLMVTMLAAVVAGILSDRIGRRAMILWSLFMGAASTLGMGLSSNFILFLIFAAIHSAAIGPILATTPALASDLAPKDEAGQYMAYNNLTTGLSGALGSLLFGAILITMNHTTFMILFILSAIFFLLGGIVFLIKVPQRDLDARIKHSSRLD